jgi:hypothetical protein
MSSKNDERYSLIAVALEDGMVLDRVTGTWEEVWAYAKTHPVVCGWDVVWEVE